MKDLAGLAARAKRPQSRLIDEGTISASRISPLLQELAFGELAEACR